MPDMEAIEITRLIAARIPELQASDIERIQIALSSETAPASTLAVLAAVVERIQMRLNALESGVPHLLM